MTARLMIAIAVTLALLSGMALQRVLCEREKAQPHSDSLAFSRSAASSSEAIEGALPLQQIMQRLHLPPRSRLLEVNTKKRNGRTLYEIELLTPGGQVMELYVDPYTAEVVIREYEHDH